MTFDIGLVLAILAVSLVLFVTERLSMDLVALLVLSSLALTRLVTPAEALAGFSNSAVVTVWAMFILSEGLTRTGVANQIGRRVLHLAGSGEVRAVLVIMITAGTLSAFMNNIGVAALMLPVVMDIAKRTGMPPSRLLMPLAYGTLLGGLTTLIGTPPNILVSEALRDQGLRPFRLFDYTPVGLGAMIGGTLFVALVGRRFLPRRNPAAESSDRDEARLREQYALHERTFEMRIPPGSSLVGKTLAESRIRAATGLSVLALVRGNRTEVVPGPDAVLAAGDRLLVEGRIESFYEIRGWRELVLESEHLDLGTLVSSEIGLAEVRLSPSSSLSGRTLLQIDFRARFGVNVLAIRRDDALLRSNLHTVVLRSTDRLLVQGQLESLRRMRDAEEFTEHRDVTESELQKVFRLGDRIFMIRVPEESILVGETLAYSRLGDAFGLRVLGIVREGSLQLMPAPEKRLKAHDELLVQGNKEELLALRGLQELEIASEKAADLGTLESEQVGMVEAVLAPRSALSGKTLREINFREKFGLQVLAIWREGQAPRTNLRDLALRFGDALLILGRREKLALLGKDPDFLVLTQMAQEAPKKEKAVWAGVIMAGVVIPVLFGWLPISIAAVVGAALMVLAGCLTMTEAYRSIEWRSIFLIAGMLPLGTAMQETGAAGFLAEGVMSTIGQFGPWAVIVALYLITALATTIVPTAALVVLMAPIAMKASSDLGISPYTVMMAVAMAASASFTSPIAHPANVLVMGPGGYRFVDYLKIGIPLSLVVLTIVLLTLPIFWPLTT